MSMIVPELETKRLYLRGIDENDTEQIVNWRSDASVYCFFKSPHKITIEEHKKWYNESYLSDTNKVDWMCITKDEWKKIGVFGFKDRNDRIEVNYLLAADSQHKGYGIEAMIAIIDYIHKIYPGKTLIAEIHKDNIASLKFIRKMGFKETSTDGRFYTYSKQEWKNVEAIYESRSGEENI